MRYLFLYIAFLLPALAFSQFHIGDSTRLSIGAKALLFTGGDATFNGPLGNSGVIVANRHVDFVENEDAGSLKFVGDTEQTLSGDTINTGNFELNKKGNLVLLTGQVRVFGNMLVTNGVIQSDDELDLIQAGTVNQDGAGYVEGKMIGQLGNTSTFTFPMGLTDANGTGFQNYLTLTANKPGTFIRVECRRPNRNLLFPDSLMNGIAEEVEWLVSVVGQDSVQATLQMDYSGLGSLATLSGKILADIHVPAIALFSRRDTLHHALTSSTQFDATNTDPSGRIASSEQIWITSVPRRFAIALVPSASEPVFYIPNAFAPNAAFAENRVFRPYFAGSEIITGVSIRVVDSFNQDVYTVNDTGSGLNLEDYGWDGILPSGQDAPDGVYYFDITLETSANVYRSVDLNQRAVLLVR